jgi:phosphoglycolate phosphatase-like HAD superfamily hydrolase
LNLAVFDIDGTLVKENRVEDGCFIEALREGFGFDDVDPDWTRYRDVTDSGLVAELCVRRLGKAPDLETLRRFRDLYSRLLIDRLEPGDGSEIAGAGVFVAKLRAHPEWRVSIATGNFLRLALHKLRRAGIPALDVPIATAEDSSRRVDLIRLAIARAQDEYGVRSFRHVVSIGDAPWDLRAARELQMPFVAIGERCGAPSSGSVRMSDYRDADEALLYFSKAVCW